MLFGAEAALASILPRFAHDSGQWLQLEFARNIMRAMLGSDVAERIGPGMLHAMAWVHPVVLALVWAHAVVVCTRVPAGEVERGTADVLFGLPVSRWEVFFSESAVWIAAGAIVVAAALVGNVAGGLAVPPEQRPLLLRQLGAACNLFCLYVAVSGFAWLASSLSDRRGRAMTTVFVVLLAAFLLTYLAQFWPPLEPFALLSPLHYHRPAPILERGGWPWRDMGVLLLAGAAMWLAAGSILSRRDLCTV